MMSHVGNDIFEEYNLDSLFEDSARGQILDLKQVNKLGRDIVSQLEVLHHLGVVHGDLKFQNICYDKEMNSYSLIDFPYAHKIYNSHGQRRNQKQLSSFFGNSLFSSDSMMNLRSPGRKDDLESLIYVICFLHSGSIPAMDEVKRDDDQCMLEKI
jgi:casein kinase I family protein HRR25